MKIVVAPDKFKGSCPADRVASAIARGWKAVRPMDEIVAVPVSDGGDGLLDAFHAACGGEFRVLPVRGPLGRPVHARWLKIGDTAVIESALASGLILTAPEERDVRLADTYGTGQLMRAALDAGCGRLIVGLGGSATNDGGAGMLRALGARFLLPGGEAERPGDFIALAGADMSGLDGRLAACEIVAAGDVDNPLCGERGASAVFGPQKGASPGDVAHMDRCLRRLSEVVAAETGFDRSGCAGAGAAGGLGWALMQCCGAVMKPGIDVVLDVSGFDALLEGAGLVITGEGGMDGQTAMGKAPVGIAERARRRGVPVAAVAGALGPGHEAVHAAGIDCVIGITPAPMELREAMARADELIEQAAARLARILDTGRRLGREP